jgi:hypothetical protein
MSSYHPGAPPPKKTNPLVWILAGIGIVLVLVVGLIVAGGLFVVYKAKQAGLDPDLMQRNPGLAMTKLLTSMNPDIEVMKVDERRGLITIRNKKDGKTVTLNFEDVKQGRISWETDEGEKVSIQGEGGSASLPAWLPAYTGATQVSNVQAQRGDTEGGLVSFKTADPAENVIRFYEDALRQEGLEVTVSGSAITAVDEDRGRKATLTAGSHEGGAQVTISYESKK